MSDKHESLTLNPQTPRSLLGRTVYVQTASGILGPGVHLNIWMR